MSGCAGHHLDHAVMCMLSCRNNLNTGLMRDLISVTSIYAMLLPWPVPTCGGSNTLTPYTAEDADNAWMAWLLTWLRKPGHTYIGMSSTDA